MPKERPMPKTAPISSPALAQLNSLVLKLTTSSDSHQREFGRLMASGAPTALFDWSNAEDQRGTSPVAIINGAMKMTALFVTFILQETIRSEGMPEAAEACQEYFGQLLVEFAKAPPKGGAERAEETIS